MKNLFKLLFIVFVYNINIYAQEYVNVTFRHYPLGQNVERAFVPGSFNNWGPNSSGRIAVDAPSQMTYVDSLGFHVKTVYLRVGDTHNYKFHEHFNADGSLWQWYTDPLNPLINYNDNNNSVLNVTSTMIFEMLPQNGICFMESPPELVAGVFSREDDPILLNQSTIFLNDSFLATFEGNMIEDLSILSCPLPVLNTGTHKIVIKMLTQKGEFLTDSTSFQVISPIIEPLPAGIVDGINFINDSTVTFSFFVHYKKFAFLIGDFNDWQTDPAYLMRQTPNRSQFWLTISGLDPNKEYRYQYLVDGVNRLADPYCDKTSDPWNDQYISDQTYPDLIPYPTGKTTEIASVFKIGEQPYQWQVENFERPEPKDLLIYELLIRDFIEEHDYKTMIDTLGYFERLGVNALELLPVNEFEGNSSWGYNPSFYFAPDKYYGPKDDLKRFIDECHKRGIAVIIDVVLNHAYGQCSLVRLHINNLNESPWFNETAPHTDFSWGYDFNHEKQATKDFVDRFTSYWLTEYNVDGFRFDFTRGFTNKPGSSGPRDDSRIAILKRIYNHIRTVDSTAFVILEHLVDDNGEKQALADYGMLLWENMNQAYSQSAMGWLEDSYRSSDLSRCGSKPGFITYMESHDEPWLMYKNLQHGRSSGDYNIKNLATALDRIKLVSAFFLTLPGPKMMWQFGELGYDQYLPESGLDRCDPKPILWEYYNQPERKLLYETISAMIKLRMENELFRDPGAAVQMRVGHGQYDRRINISNDSLSATIIGNFDVTSRDINPNFQHIGTWYDYFTGDTLLITDCQNSISLLPGEFIIFTDKKLEPPAISTSVNQHVASNPKSFMLEQNYPNPFNSSTTIRYSLAELKPTQTIVRILNILGQEVKTLVSEKQVVGNYQIVWNGLDNSGNPVTSGVYFYSINSGNFHAVKKLVFIQ